MANVLLDTHAWAWSLKRDYRLSATATNAINSADAVYVSPISFYEIGQKVRLGKWPAMEPFVDQLLELLDEQRGWVAPLDPETCLAAAKLDWTNRDPFDRILGATAVGGRMPIISADPSFDDFPEAPDKLIRIW
ncbi:MAG: type II toxin-antitoxin system VapC family toxin [Geminicoccaceae bacterium]